MSIRHVSASAAILSFLFWVVSLNAQSAANTLTWHNDVARQGANRAETILTLTDVSANTFGKTGFISTDGIVDAQPLYVAGLNIGGANHNVVFIVSEHDSVYAADAASGAILWQTSLLQAGETTSDD